MSYWVFVKRKNSYSQITNNHFHSIPVNSISSSDLLPVDPTFQGESGLIH